MPIPDQLKTHTDPDGLISRLPAKRSKKVELALGLLEDLEPGRTYTEKEITEIFSAYVLDHAYVRRELVDSGFLIRDRYGAEYRRARD